MKFKRKVVENANAVIAISENTKKDLLEFYSIDPNKVHVTHLSSSLSGIPTKKPLSDIPKHYLLYVGTRAGYKNFPFFIKSIARLLKREQVHLLCLGGGKFTNEEVYMLNNLKLANLVIQRQFNSDSELAYYYKNALAHVISSLYEGFGLTVLEAFDCECAVVTSNTSSLTEVAGNSAIYFDPKNGESIYTAVEKVIIENSYREKLIHKGKERVKKFSWDKTAAKTAKVYESLN